MQKALATFAVLSTLAACDGAMVSSGHDAGVASDAATPTQTDAYELADAMRDRPDAERDRATDAGPGPDANTEPGELPILGTVSLLSEPCPRTRALAADQRCEYVEVDCSHAGTTPNMRAELRITDPVGTERGTIWLGSGSQGGGFYGGEPGSHSDTLIRGLAAAGFRVVERAWEVGRETQGGWFTGTTGVRVASCRSGTLFGYVHDHLTAPSAPFCASGNSGGSMELAYIMSVWRGDRFASLVVPTSGPAVRTDLACRGASDAEWVAECEAIQSRYPLDPGVSCELDQPRRIIDQAYGGRTICTMTTEADIPTLRADSPSGDGATAAFPETTFRFLYGANDGMGAVTLGIGYAELLEESGTDVEIEVIPDGIHDMGDDPVGSVRLLEILRDGCRS